MRRWMTTRWMKLFKRENPTDKLIHRVSLLLLPMSKLGPGGKHNALWCWKTAIKESTFGLDIDPETLERLEYLGVALTEIARKDPR